MSGIPLYSSPVPKFHIFSCKKVVFALWVPVTKGKQVSTKFLLNPYTTVRTQNNGSKNLLFFQKEKRYPTYVPNWTQLLLRVNSTCHPHPTVRTLVRCCTFSRTNKVSTVSIHSSCMLFPSRILKGMMFLRNIMSEGAQVKRMPNHGRY